MSSPYDSLPDSAFWRTGVVGGDPARPSGLYVPKFPVTRKTGIMTAGSCFAQHVHRNLRDRDWSVIDTETPIGTFPDATLARFGYGMYSARYGNIYTVRQLVQLLGEAFGHANPSDLIWTRDGRYFDAQRPNVEPDGLENAAHVEEARAAHLKAVTRAVEQADLFVFTLGLTEAWMHAPSGTVYPTAPGTIAGKYDSDIHRFHNFSYDEIMADLARARDLLQTVKPSIKMLLTVSPVPLTATATGGHVLAASTYSKAVLRAAAGAFSAAHEDVDYFPSFEVIINPAARSAFYKPNLRSVDEAGVAAAMHLFFAAHDPDHADVALAPRAPVDDVEEDDVVCEEVLIEAKRS
ncbi:GSCFA domain-containing protein [Celeribacter sp.]|uniref:GSCFA domain-containing protein n=1 Tax=Celeribacter sp. TaxID=1890673 RepID=UPI003A8CE810